MIRRSSVNVTLCAVLGLSSAAQAGEPADGIFDTWGVINSGKAIVSFNEGAAGTDVAADSVVGPDGSMYLAGTVTDQNGKTRIGVAKLDPNGHPDLSFHGDGKNISVEIDVTARRMVLTPDNRILVAGYKTISPTDRDFIVCRFSAVSGTNLQFPAPTNSSCVKPVFPAGTRDEANDIVLLADGSFIIAGTLNIGPSSLAGFAKFLPNGQPDLSFGLQGSNVASIRTEGVFTKHEIEAVGIASNGRVVGVGRTVSAGSSQVGGLMIRLTSAGQLSDPEFAFFSPAVQGGNTSIHDLVLVDDPTSVDDAIVAVGHAAALGGKLGGLIVKIRSNGGALDTDFGDSPGYTKVVLGAGNLSYRAVARQPGGGYVAVGERPGQEDVLDLEVRRFEPGGSTDLSFGVGSSVVVDFGTLGGIDIASGISVHHDGVYFSGYSYVSGSDYDMTAGKLYLDRIFYNGLQ